MKTKVNKITDFLEAVGTGKVPLRSCYTLHQCFICGFNISYGESYYDQGINRRAHEACVGNRMLER